MKRQRVTDTHPEIQKRVDEIMSAKTPEERVLLGVSMFQSSKVMVLERLKRENPRASKAFLNRLLLKELYPHRFEVGD